MQYINRHHFNQRFKGPDPFLQILGKLMICMNMLKFHVFLWFWGNFGRRGHLVTPFLLASLFDILKKFQTFLGTSFYYTLIVMQDFLDTSVFNISFVFLDFTGTFLLHISFFPRLFMVSTGFSWYLTFWNVIFDIRFSTFFYF